MAAFRDLRIIPLPDSGDDRGFSSAIPHEYLVHLEAVEDLHVTTLEPGYIRGNHFHRVRNELLLVHHADTWSAFWDTGEGTRVESQTVKGVGAALIVVPKLWSHAIRNDGDHVLQIVGMTDGRFDPNAPDAFPRRVADPR
jgi:dTDP-4-dehydrorhamnose 3,5-epimerase-like enzyme